MDAKQIAADLESEYMAVANGDKKPAKIALEPMVRAVQELRRLAALPSDAAQAPIARALGEWHEDHGNAVWFTWQDGEWLGEPSWIGQPDDSDWPGYHTHWIPHPAFPAPARTYTTQPGESVAGIALRQCGSETQWHRILQCNPEFEDSLPNDYFPVGTVLMLPSIAATVAPAAAAQSDETNSEFLARKYRQSQPDERAAFERDYVAVWNKALTDAGWTAAHTIDDVKDLREGDTYGEGRDYVTVLEQLRRMADDAAKYRAQQTDKDKQS
jgi:hypothetical protein